jgi:hypothetical protein
MTEWERKRHAIQSLKLLKLAIDQARTNTLLFENENFVSASNKFEIHIDNLSDSLHTVE